MSNHSPVDFEASYGKYLVLDSLRTQLLHAIDAGDEKTIKILNEAIKTQEAEYKGAKWREALEAEEQANANRKDIIANAGVGNDGHVMDGVCMCPACFYSSGAEYVENGTWF